ncbi:hypothetical protein KR009_000174, partial [Drosophila setifemur]
GLSMKPNRKYTQTIVKSFHISGVALDKGDEAKLYLTADKQKYIVATVTKNIPQVPLDLNFSKGDQIMFQTTGDATVSLLGYLHDIDSDDEDEEFNIQDLLKGKPKEKKNGKAQEEDDEDDDEDDEDEDIDDSQLMEEYESFLENGEEEDDDEDDDEEAESEEEEDDSDDDEEEEVEQPKAKVAKLSPASAKKGAKEQNGVAKKEEPKQQPQQKAKKGEKPEPKKEQPQAKAKQQPAGGERNISGGVKVVDIQPGKGEEAKQGKRVSVYYVGRLQSNNKIFDSMLQGKGLKFALGGGEVIKGWDVGVAGMKVGGKRRITCPPHMAYGGRGAPPKIPPNSTLVFEVELKGVH